MLGEIKQEVGMARWPASARHVDIVLSHHFLEGTNSEIRRLDLPALAPLSKRMRMDHVNESLESQVRYFGILLHNVFDQLFHLALHGHLYGINIYILYLDEFSLFPLLVGTSCCRLLRYQFHIPGLQHRAML